MSSRHPVNAVRQSRNTLVRYRFYSLLFLLFASSSQAGVIAIVIDDIGYNYAAGIKAAHLHPNITLSILPDAPEARRLAKKAYAMGRELMLHLPMQSVNAQSTEPVVLNLDMDKATLERTVLHYLQHFPEVSGVNNHQGSLLTRHPGHMAWLMEALQSRDGLFFVDSRTDKRTVAERTARDYHLKNTRRDVFLDDGDITCTSVWGQVKKLHRLASRHGYALAIGHPHATTLSVLKKAIPWLEKKGDIIVTVSRYINAKELRQCPECSSPSLKLVKSSKLLPSSTCCVGPILR
ncbi:MAG TPA: divergent polysaccharide deacetylase family protein [Gammaproteobacteria bacterium]|nr:divergent polysaccharide deacetylase family protein [Gammaproteobacteria bacterium]